MAGLTISVTVLLMVSFLDGCEYPKGYINGFCVHCPENTLHISTLGFPTCVQTCPTSAPFILKDSCVEKCPHGMTSQRKDAVRYCKNETQQYSNICVHNECGSQNKVCFRMRCFPECPLFTFQYRNDCVIECLSDKPFIHNGSCVAKCPVNQPMHEHGVCVSNCSSGFLISGNDCIQKCSSQQYMNGNNCLDNCTNGVIFYNNDNKHCYDRCPYLTVKNDTICEVYCPQSHPFLLNGTCVKKCPESSKFILKEKSPFVKDVIMVCVIMCPKYVSQNNLCTDSCLSNEVLYRNECRHECPESDSYTAYINSVLQETHTFLTTYDIYFPITADALCVVKCPDKYIVEHQGCFPDCLDEKLKMEFNSTCIAKCPDDFPLMKPFRNRFVCVDVCPEVHSLNICQSYCPYPAHFILFGQCLEKCPDEYPFVYTTLQNHYFRRYCNASCPKYHYGYQCYDECPSFASHNVNNECLDCGQIGKFELDKNHCVDTCPYAVLKNHCVDTCPYAVFNGHCVNVCPENAIYIANKTCVSSCPSDLPLININRISNFRIEQDCRASCPKGRFLYRNICVNYCERDMQFVHNNTCVAKCPTYSPLQFRYTLNKAFDVLNYIKLKWIIWENNAEVIKCVETCDIGQYQLNMTCREQCPSKTYIFNKKCVSKCPPVLKYNKEGKCVNSCPKYFNNLNSCLELCPDDHILQGNLCSYCAFRFDSKCMNQCPPETVADSSNHCIPKYSKDLTTIYIFIGVLSVLVICFLVCCIRICLPYWLIRISEICNKSTEEHDQDVNEMLMLEETTINNVPTNVDVSVCNDAYLSDVEISTL